jgi:lipopolysaccharide export system protein LptA
VSKKLILALVTFVLAAATYFIFARGDRQRRSHTTEESSEAVRRFVSLPTSTQPSKVIRQDEIAFSPGDRTLARVYDDITGRLKYQFEAQTWEPVSETDFRLRELLIQIFMPHGEITYISADEAQITLARKSRNRVDPKSGWLRGNVKVAIDRTTAEWREAHAELADRYAHPDDLINIDMQDARFDLERAELISEGAILVDGADVRVEDVTGLTLQWDQVDNRIDVLRFKQGGKMTLRRGGRIVDFALPGGQRDVRSGAGPAEVAAGQQAPLDQSPTEIPRALAMKPVSIGAIPAEQAAAQIRLEGGIIAANRPRSLPQEQRPSPPAPAGGQAHQLRSADELAAESETMKTEARGAAAGLALEAQALESLVAPAKKARRIHTYRATFNNQVVIEQKDGLRTIGQIEADKLEINFDFGEQQRSLTDAGRSSKSPPPTSRPSGEPAVPKPSPEDASANPLAPQQGDRTKLILAWNGPLELRPLRMEPNEQTGQRFDAIATGGPVRVQSEQGTASCRQLVYRHERRQVWLAGSDSDPVQLAVSESRRLQGREVFFDQKRGLALVDGPGVMVDERKPPTGGPRAGDDLFQSLAGGSTSETKTAGKRRAPVEIRWTRGVELELGTRSVERADPSTGRMEQKQREFLQRAWFHGAASISQGEEQVNAEEIAVTFGVPASKEDLADHIQHLNLLGDVRLQRGDESVTAERLDAEMVVARDRRNLPRVVDAEGKVRVRQGDREISAEQMHVVLTERRGSTPKSADAKAPTFGSSRLAVESLEASGDVFVRDPRHNLRIRQSERLRCSMGEDNRLLHAAIVGRPPDALARVRYGDVAIHGHIIEIHMDEEAVDVPGPGQAWMMTQEDFTGRKLRKPAPVKITWTDRLQFRMARDYGLFVGKVHSQSQAFTLDCDTLTVRFAKAPPVREARKEGVVERFYLLGAIVGDKAETKEVEATPLTRERKRPTYVVADGHAQAMSCQYAPDAPDGQKGRLLSRLWISGDQIAADLAREQLSVPCRGSLLIEDYQFDGAAAKAVGPTARSAVPLMSTLRDEGPSQTAVTWENSMDSFLDRGLVAFDKNVAMVHRSGQELVMQQELSTAMRVDREDLRHLSKGRKATLSCGHLLLEFLTGRQDQAASDASSPPIRATDLKRLIAKQAVHLQEDTKSLMGDYLQYMHETSEVRLEGSTALEARIIDQDERDQRLTMWRGPLLIWDRRTNRIEAPGAVIRASRQ